MSWRLSGISKAGDSTTILNSPCQCSVNLTLKKSISWYSNPPVCQFVPLASCPTSEHQWKEPVSVFFAPTLQVFLHMGEAPSLSQAKHSQLSWPFFTGEMLQSLCHYSGPSLESLQHTHVSLDLGRPETDTGLQVQPHRCWAKGKDRLPQHAANSYPCSPTYCYSSLLQTLFRIPLVM